MNTNISIDHTEKVISWNVRVLLASRGSTQAELSSYMEIKPAAMSKKLNGTIAWSVADLVKAANFFHVIPAELMDDKLMRQMGIYPDIKNERTLTSETSGSVVLGAGLEPARL